MLPSIYSFSSEFNTECNIFAAGTDTTRMTLNWIWHYLAAYPEVQKRAQEEVDSVLGKIMKNIEGFIEKCIMLLCSVCTHVIQIFFKIVLGFEWRSTQIEKF